MEHMGRDVKPNLKPTVKIHLKPELDVKRGVGLTDERKDVCQVANPNRVWEDRTEHLQAGFADIGSIVSAEGGDAVEGDAHVGGGTNHSLRHRLVVAAQHLFVGDQVALRPNASNDVEDALGGGIRGFIKGQPEVPAPQGFLGSCFVGSKHLWQPHLAGSSGVWGETSLRSMGLQPVGMFGQSFQWDICLCQGLDQNSAVQVLSLRGE